MWDDAVAQIAAGRKSDEKYGALRVAMPSEDIVDVGSRRSMMSGVDLVGKQQRAPKESDVEKMKLDASGNHQSFGGEWFDGFATGLPEGGRGRFAAGSSTGGGNLIPDDMCGTPVGMKRKRVDDEHDDLPASAQKKERKAKFEAGACTKKYEALASEMAALKAKLDKAPLPAT